MAVYNVYVVASRTPSANSRATYFDSIKEKFEVSESPEVYGKFFERAKDNNPFIITEGNPVHGCRETAIQAISRNLDKCFNRGLPHSFGVIEVVKENNLSVEKMNKMIALYDRIFKRQFGSLLIYVNDSGNLTFQFGNSMTFIVSELLWIFRNDEVLDYAYKLEYNDNFWKSLSKYFIYDTVGDSSNSNILSSIFCYYLTLGLALRNSYDNGPCNYALRSIGIGCLTKYVKDIIYSKECKDVKLYYAGIGDSEFASGFETIVNLMKPKEPKKPRKVKSAEELDASREETLKKLEELLNGNS